MMPAKPDSTNRLSGLSASIVGTLKARIGGRHGHLSNETAAAILQACRHGALQHLVAAHLSEQNNRPELARASLAAAVQGRADDIVVADPRSGFDWLRIR